MTAMTDGTTTRQAQFCHQRKYYEGTYAARVRFSDRPVAGPDGDQVVETLYTIAPLKAPLDPDYSEQDFEYLPNGGWGGGDLTLHTTTWETFRPEPQWLQVSASESRRGSLDGWHTLVLQIANRKVRYFLDGALLATHGEPYYPEERMSINFNLWFIREGLIDSRERARLRRRCGLGIPRSRQRALTGTKCSSRLRPCERPAYRFATPFLPCSPHWHRPAISDFARGHCARTTAPPFITNDTACSFDTSCTGSPPTAMRSASNPGRMRPR